MLALPAEYSVGSAWELALYVGLGLLAGLVAVLYNKSVWRAQDVFARLRSPAARIALGALIVGGLDLIFREDLWGQGHESLDLSIVAQRSALFLIGLTAAKLIATAATFGAGGTGGVFTPSLFIGATLGGALGALVNALFPQWGIAPGALAMVGMAGVVSGATHAPLTAIFMVFEMTGDYGLILPLMLTSVIAYMLARRIHPESIYTEWLVRRGVVLTQGTDAVVLARARVQDCYHRDPVTLSSTLTVPEVTERVRKSRQTEFPVINAHGRLVGMLDRDRLREIEADDSRLLTASDLATPGPKPVSPEDSLLTALRRLGAHDVDYLPVVSPRDRGRLLGIVSRHDLTAAYERALTAEEHL